MKSIQIHDTRFIYDEERKLFLPLIRVEDRDKRGVLFWTLFNTDLFREEWGLKPAGTDFMESKDIINLIDQYGDYQSKTNNLGLKGRIWNNLGIEMSLDGLKLWGVMALYKHITLSDLKGFGMNVRVKDTITGNLFHLNEHTILPTLGVNRIWDADPEYLSQCPGFTKKIVFEFYTIIVNDKQYFLRLSDEDETDIFGPYVKSVKSPIICAKFKTENDALGFTLEHSEYFAEVGYEIKQINRPAYI